MKVTRFLSHSQLLNLPLSLLSSAAGREATSPGRATVGIHRRWPKRCRFTTTPWGPCTLPKPSFSATTYQAGGLRTDTHSSSQLTWCYQCSEAHRTEHGVSLFAFCWVWLNYALFFILFNCVLLYTTFALPHVRMYAIRREGTQTNLSFCTSPQSCLLTCPSGRCQSSNARSGGMLLLPLALFFALWDFFF